MDTPCTLQFQVLAEWKRVINEMRWTHWLNFNPCLPGVDAIAVQRIGGCVAERLMERLRLPPRSVLLVPETSADGLAHLHGFAVVPDRERAAALEAQGERWAVQRMTGLVSRHYSRTGIVENTPTALIQRRDREPEAATRYALKNPIGEGKFSTVIWR